MDILFLNPPLSLEELYSSLAEGGSELPPLGLALLAAVVREKGRETAILDAMSLHLKSDETVDRILAARPKYLGITSTTISIYNAAEAAAAVKKKAPEIVTIIGGAHITAAPVETMERFPEFDIGVYGEGEDTIVDLLDALDKGRSPAETPGVIYRSDGGPVMSEQRPFIRDLDRLPFPAWDLLPDLVKCYQPAADSLHRSPATLLITSRGCPGRCTFCDRSIFGNRIRGFSADYCVRMIKRLIADYGIRDVFIEDDNFLVLRKRLREFCRIIIEEKIDITWSCMGRTDSFNRDDLSMLNEAGCWQINLGLESGSQRILDTLKKGTRLEEMELAIRKIRENGMRVKGLFMLGNPGETEETIRATLDFIRRNPMDDFHMTCFTPFPGSEIYEVADQYGAFDPDWRKMNMFAPDNFIPHGLDRETMDRYFRKAYRAFYLRPSVIWYYIKKLRDPSIRRKVIRGGMAFLKFITKK